MRNNDDLSGDERSDINSVSPISGDMDNIGDVVDQPTGDSSENLLLSPNKDVPDGAIERTGVLSEHPSEAIRANLLTVPTSSPIDATISVAAPTTSAGDDDVVVVNGVDPNDPDALDAEIAEEKQKVTFLGFFLSSSIVSQAIKCLIGAIVIVGVGFLLKKFYPDEPVAAAVGDAAAAAVKPMVQLSDGLILLGSIMTAVSLLVLLLHSFISAVHKNRLLENSSTMYYLAELQVQVAIAVVLLATFVLLNIPINDEYKKSLFASHETLFPAFSKLSIFVTGTTVLLGIKRHFMRKLAMSFNYTNYMDRIKECLWAEETLQSLTRSRSAYKFRSRWKVIMPFIGGGGTASGTPSAQHQRSARRRSEALRPHPPTGPGHLAVPIADNQLSINSTTSYMAAGGHPQPASSASSAEPLNNAVPQPTNTPPQQPPSKPATASTTMDSAKKRNFDAFLVLANRTLVQFDVAGDYRVETGKEAKRLASKLYHWLKPPNRDYLVPNDFAAYLEDPEDVKRLVAMLNRRSGDIVAISEVDLRRVIDQILQDRYGLAKSMQSIETALGRIEAIFTAFLVFLSTVITLALVSPAAEKVMTSSAQVVGALAFVFGTSAKQLFESIIFLLVIHPFDVGDRVYMILGTGSVPPFGEHGMDNLVVSEMHVLSTVFERWDGVKVYAPNYLLANKPIFNVRRSGPINDILRIAVDYNTPTERMAELRRRLDAWLRKESADFTGYNRINVEYLENCNRMGLFVIVQHRTNWQDYEQQLARRTKVLAFLKSTLDDLAVGYLPPVQRVAAFVADGASVAGGASWSPLLRQ